MGSFGIMGAATGGIKIHVAKKIFDRAQELISEKE